MKWRHSKEAQPIKEKDENEVTKHKESSASKETKMDVSPSVNREKENLDSNNRSVRMS